MDTGILISLVLLFAPIVGALAIGQFGKKMSNGGDIIGIAALGTSWACALALFAGFGTFGGAHWEFTWLTVDGLDWNLGITLDVGHVYVTGEGEPRAIIERLGSLIFQVHLEDMKRGIHEHLPPGEGDVDFDEVFDALSGVGYAGPICWELSRSSHAAPEMLRRARECFHLALSKVDSR